MMKVKDGYKKLIGTSYSGSASNLLLSNGGDIPLTSLFTALTNDNNQISITVGGTNKKLTVAYATKASLDADGNVITSTYATKNELNATKYWANVPISATASNTTKPTLHPDFAFNVAANTIIAGGINKAIASPLAKYLWHDILSFGVNSWPTVYVSSDGGSTWRTSTDINLLKKLFILRDDQSVTVLDNTKTAIRWVWNNSQFHACQAAYLNIGFAYSASLAKFNIVWDVSADGTTWSTGFSTNNVGYAAAPYWFYVNNTWSNIKYARLTLTRTSAAGTSANLSAIKLLSYRWGNQGRGGEYEYPYNWDASLNIYPRVSNASSLGLASNKWSNVYATTFTGDLEGNAKTATSANSAKSDAAGNEISTTYAPLASPTFTGTPSAPTAAAGTNTTQIATTAFVNKAVGAGFAANDAMLFKGTIGTGGTVKALPNTHSIGWTYRVITAGTYAGQSCEIGDLIICIADGTAANNAHWAVAQGNISNMSTVVAGPSSATSGNIAVFDGTTGKKIKDGGAKISDFLTKTTYEWNKEIAFGSTGKLCIGKFVMYDSAVIVTISATTNLTYHGVLVIATLNHGTASGGNIKATVYGDAANTIASNIYIYSHPANDGLVEVYFSPTAYSKNLIHVQAQSLAQRGTVSYANLAFDICTSVTAIPNTATLKPTNALTETFMGKSAVSVSNLLSSGDKIGTITINGTAKDIFQTPLTWNNIANKPTSFTPSTHTHDYAPYQSWTASVKGVTWSRLCYVKVGNSTVGSKFILNIAATRNSVVYNDTYIITAHHSQNGKIAKIGGCNYSAGYQIRINTDSTGNCYVELYDNCYSATASTSLSVYCRLLSLFTGEVTKYTAFTDGTTLASGFKTVTTLTTTNEDFQGTVSASRLTTTSKTAWGLTYWTSNGVPTSISGNMTGVGSISMSDALTLTGTTAETAQVKFSRTSYNYITFPSTGYLALATAANGSSIIAAVDSSSVSPYENNKGSLGKADKVWNAIYATTFVGNVSGNVSGSAGSVAWGNVTGKPSSFTPSSHTHYSLATEGDKRNDNTTPDLYKNSLIFRGLKYSNKINSPASSTYSYLVGLRGWSDKSGGGAHELAFNDVGIQRRNSTSTSDAWGTWKTLLDSENFTTFVTTDAIGAAPSGHTHAYLPLTGGTVTGPIEFNTGTLNNNYNEGVRITAAANNWAGITFGSTGLAGAPTNGWFAAKNPSGQFIITPDNSSNTTGLTLNKNGDALWRNNKIYHAGNLTALKNPSALTIFNNNYDGSSAVTVNTISADVLTLGYLNIHPENSAIVIPFINNDLAFLSKKGGAYKIYKTTSTTFTTNTLTKVSTSVSDGDNMFDGSPSYTMLTESGEFTAVIDLSLHKLFQYSNLFYIDFGSSGWRAKNISVYVKNANTETNYTSKGSVTNQTKGNWYCSVAHSSTSGGTTVQGFNRLRIVLSGFATNNSTSGKRIALVGLINYGSEGVKETFISRGGCNGIYGSLLPHSNNSLDLGSSSKKWANVYATTFSGTATKATADKDGVAFQGNYLRKITAPNNAANDFNNFGNMTLTGRGDPTTGASLKNAPWTGAGPAGGYGVLTYLWSGYGTQMAWGYNSNKIYIRNKYYKKTTAAWQETWDSIALTSEIPTKVSLLTNDSGFLTSVPSNYVTTDTTQTITGNKRFTSGAFSLYVAGNDKNDSWFTFTDDGSSVYSFGIRRPYASYGFLLKEQIPGKDTAYYKIWHEGNLTNVSLLTNDAGYLTSLPTHDHNSAYMRVIEQNSTFAIDAIPNDLAPGVHKIHISGKEYSSILCGNDYTGALWLLYFHPHASYDLAIKYRYRDGAWRTILDSTNSSVSKEGETLTVTINGTSQSLTNSTYNFSGASFTSGQSNTGEHNCDNIKTNGHWYYTSNGPTTTLGATTSDGALYTQAHSTSWVAQIAQDYRNGNLYTRSHKGDNSNNIPSGWLPWRKVAYTGEAQPASDVYDWAKAATKPSYAFNEITPGNATIGDGANSIYLRTSSSWASAIYHQTSADESVVFLNKGKEVNSTANYTTSWIFAYGNPSDRPVWSTLTPALQIKGACVAINKLIGSKVGGAYNLDVNGTANATELYENGTRVLTTSGTALNTYYIRTQLLNSTTFYTGYRAWLKWIDGSTLGLKIAKNNTETDATISTYKFKADAAYSADTAVWADGAAGADVANADIDGNPIHTTYLKLSGGTLTGGVTISALNTIDVMYYANATNKGYKIGFGVGTSGNRGIYDAQAGGWILKIDSSHKVTFSGTAACADTVKVTATSMKEVFYIPFVDAVSGARTVNANSSLYYNPSSNVLTSYRFASTVATGTAPMTISSTTVVTNLNADMVDGKHASDFAIPVGTIMMWAGSTAPTGWLLCNGAAVSRTTYRSLFAVISTTYGTGNGSSTFNVPNLVKRFPLGADTQGLIGLDSSRDGYDTTLGKSGGSATHTLTVSELPSHRHSFTALRDTTRVAGKAADVNNTLGIQPSSGYTGYSGSNLAHNNIPPFLAVNFIIKY